MGQVKWPECVKSYVMRIVTICNLFWCDSPQWARASSFTRYIDHTHNDTPHSVGLLWTRISARHKELYLTTHNTHNRQTSMPQVVFEPTISTGERRQTYAYDRVATGTGSLYPNLIQIGWLHENNASYMCSALLVWHSSWNILKNVRNVGNCI
jgi:hypothetical protein